MQVSPLSQQRTAWVYTKLKSRGTLDTPLSCSTADSYTVIVVTCPMMSIFSNISCLQVSTTAISKQLILETNVNVIRSIDCALLETSALRK